MISKKGGDDLRLFFEIATPACRNALRRAGTVDTTSQ